MLNYPITFEPILKEKIWGGDKLKRLFNKNSSLENIGESWEISGVKESISIVANGELKGQSLTNLLETFKEKLVGLTSYKQFGNEFPLLIKFIDAKTALSVQLHPNDQLAQQRHNSFGKTEMWYVLQADQGANLNIGFKYTISKEDYIKHLNNKTLTEILHFEPVQKGDSVFINTGKVHAIGAGVVLAEIQQTSDITYRIYDWDRVDIHGHARELHTDMALDAIDFEKKNDYKLPYDKTLNQSNSLAKCSYFTTNFLPINGEVKKNYNTIDSFIIFMCVSGRANIFADQAEQAIETGQTILIPAIINEVIIKSIGCELLEIYIE